MEDTVHGKVARSRPAGKATRFFPRVTRVRRMSVSDTDMSGRMHVEHKRETFAVDPPRSSHSSATTAGLRLCCCQTTTAGHQPVTQKPPRRGHSPNLLSPSRLRREQEDENRPISRWPVKFRVPGVVIRGLPKVRWTLGLQELPTASSPVVVLGLTGRPLVFFRSVGRWRCRCFPIKVSGWPEVSVTVGKLCGGFRSPAKFRAAGVSPEFPQTNFSGAKSTVPSFGGAVVSGQPRFF
ncbi:hypothetical protein Cgig2_003214 [Carnegiea gigantea]|uniref:Uncharacterized protein n=1 Tax=Carnegiea gigantea TaxID=171969 RepID=A0A9Q1QCK9_9CARY|nr:hypothetical protein Cgig2_003214 [Carnegiea gigantea]